MVHHSTDIRMATCSFLLKTSIFCYKAHLVTRIKDSMDHHTKGLPKRDTGWKATQKVVCMCLQVPLSLLIGTAKAGHWDTGHQPDFLLTHWPTPLLGLSRGRRGEKVRIGKKKREQHSSSLLVLELLAFFRAVAFFQAHIIQSNLPSVTTPFFTFEDDALDVSPSQGDLGLPPAMATISSPQGCSVGPVFPHKHLEAAWVQPLHLVPEGQAKVPWVHEMAER